MINQEILNNKRKREIDNEKDEESNNLNNYQFLLNPNIIFKNNKNLEKYNFALEELDLCSVSKPEINDAKILNVEEKNYLLVLHDYFLSIFEITSLKSRHLKTIQLYKLFNDFNIFLSSFQKIHPFYYNAEEKYIIIFFTSNENLIISKFDINFILKEFNKNLIYYKNILSSEPKQLCDNFYIIYGYGYLIKNFTTDIFIINYPDNYIHDCEYIGNNKFIACEFEKIKLIQIYPHKLLKTIPHFGYKKKIKTIKNCKIFFIYFQRDHINYIDFYDCDKFQFIKTFIRYNEIINVGELLYSKSGDILLGIVYKDNKISIYNYEKNSVVLNVNNFINESNLHLFIRIENDLIAVLNKNYELQVLDYIKGNVIFKHKMNKAKFYWGDLMISKNFKYFIIFNENKGYLLQVTYL